MHLALTHSHTDTLTEPMARGWREHTDCGKISPKTTIERVEIRKPARPCARAPDQRLVEAHEAERRGEQSAQCGGAERGKPV